MADEGHVCALYSCSRNSSSCASRSSSPSCSSSSSTSSILAARSSCLTSNCPRILGARQGRRLKTCLSRLRSSQCVQLHHKHAHPPAHRNLVTRALAFNARFSLTKHGFFSLIHDRADRCPRSFDICVHKLHTTPLVFFLTNKQPEWNFHLSALALLLDRSLNFGRTCGECFLHEFVHHHDKVQLFLYVDHCQQVEIVSFAVRRRARSVSALACGPFRSQSESISLSCTSIAALHELYRTHSVGVHKCCGSPPPPPPLPPPPRVPPHSQRSTLFRLLPLLCPPLLRQSASSSSPPAASVDMTTTCVRSDSKSSTVLGIFHPWTFLELFLCSPNLPPSFFPLLALLVPLVYPFPPSFPLPFHSLGSLWQCVPSIHSTSRYSRFRPRSPSLRRPSRCTSRCRHPSAPNIRLIPRGIAKPRWSTTRSLIVLRFSLFSPILTSLISIQFFT